MTTKVNVESDEHFTRSQCSTLSALGYNPDAPTRPGDRVVKEVREEGHVEYRVIESHYGGDMLIAVPEIDTFTMNVPDVIVLEGNWFPYWFKYRGNEYVLDNTGDVAVQLPDLSDRTKSVVLRDLEALCSILFRK